MSAAPMPTTIPYRPKPLAAILATLFFAACAAVLGWTAWTNDAGLVLNGIFTFTQRGATIFYGVLTALSGTFVVLGLYMLWKGMTSTAQITLSDEGFQAPPNLMRKDRDVLRFDEITGLRRYKIQRQDLFEIQHLGGKTTLDGSFFPNKATFEQFVDHVHAQVGAANAPR